VGEPALAGKEPNEVLGERRIAAGLEYDGAHEETGNDVRLAIGAIWPVDGHGFS
jgi:hypothetical protein